ncbi:MAG: hypothetical protein PF541_13765 [Prolixibacteraceae bacterium]|jgi:hypothetical protein|nr:hypothetical protein [Prolixibacteraceae bacterium]
MSKHLFILTIPGSGTKTAGFSEKLQKDIARYTKRTQLKNNYTIIECRPYNVTGIDDSQKALFERMNKNNKLGGLLNFRRQVLEGFGDAVVFDRDPANANSSYKKIHNYIKDSIETIHDLMQNYDESILVVLAGSMAVYIINCYVWDADNNKGIFETTPATNKNNLRDLNYMASIGCNIPIYVSDIPENKIIAIDRRNAEFTWDNYYDKNDVLGWPLKPLSPTYNALITRDEQINTGSYVGSHIRYWDDNSFTRPFSEKLVELFGSN